MLYIVCFTYLKFLRHMHTCAYMYIHIHKMPFDHCFLSNPVLGGTSYPLMSQSSCAKYLFSCLSELSPPIAHLKICLEMPQKGVLSLPQHYLLITPCLPYLVIMFFLAFPCYLPDDPDLVSSCRIYHSTFSLFDCIPPIVLYHGCSDVLLLYLAHFL